MTYCKGLVSVVIPAYNHENYICETVKSIVNQSYTDIELIIVDDGSKDSTWDEINKMKSLYNDRFSRFDIEKQQNAGCALTLNKLIQKACGEYIYIIASDDLAKPEAIKLQVNFLANNPEYGLVVGDNEFIDSQGKKCYKDKEYKIVYNEKDAFFKTFADSLKYCHPYFDEDKFGTYETLYINNYVPNGYLIRHSLFEKIGNFTKEAPLEDYFLMLQLSKYTKFKYLDKVLFSYRIHETNTVSNLSYMYNVTGKTKIYEENLLSKIPDSELSQSILKIKKHGALIAKHGIPNILELCTFVKSIYKIKVLKVFNIKIYKWTKKDRKYRND